MFLKTLLSSVLIVCSSWLLLPAQDTLTLEQAISLALDNNYGIRVARYTREQGWLAVYPGNAGLLPTFFLSGTGNYNNNDIEAELINNDPTPGAPETRTVSQSGIATNNFGASVGLRYTLFDGLGNIKTYKVLEASAEATEAAMRSQIEQTLGGLIGAYYQVARNTRNLRILDSSLRISRQRLAYVRNKRTFGSATQLEVLNAEVDRNTDSTAQAQARLNLENSYRDLNLLLGIEIEARYPVSQEVQFMSTPTFDRLQQLAMENNASLKAAEQDLTLAEQSLGVARGNLFPRLDLNASYNFNRADNGPLAFARTTQNLGLAVGGTVSINLFDGLRVRRNIQDAKVGIAASKVQLEQAEATLTRDLATSYATYRTTLQLLELERASFNAAQANFERTVEAFRLGQATALQFRDAQINLLRASNQIVELTYDIKLLETELLRLTGQLVSEDELWLEE